jgi:hypothetical protein
MQRHGTFNHYHLPDEFTLTYIIALIKNKGGDLIDVDNYRAIAEYNCCTKVFHFFLHYFIFKANARSALDNIQFGVQCWSIYYAVHLLFEE